jgi:hypothetical protein
VEWLQDAKTDLRKLANFVLVIQDRLLIDMRLVTLLQLTLVQEKSDKDAPPTGPLAKAAIL